MKIRTLNDNMTPLAPKTLQEWEGEKAKLLANLRFASSIDLIKHDAPLNAKVFGAIEYENFIVEKVIFQSLPGFYVTGNLYRPKDTSKKYPAILNPHGHWTHGRMETKDLARVPQRCANLAMRGMVAFIYDMIGYNDSTQISHNGNLPEYEQWNIGRFTLQLNNSLKAVDFVSSLPYVDAERIGCTGCSGGGTQTYFLTALDPRIKVAAPINMASTLMQGGCICENTPFLRTIYNNIDYTMTIAPRPLFLSASDGDWTVHAQEIEFPAVEKIYALYNAAENFSHFYQSAPHCYNLPIRERVYAFFCRHFGLENPYEHEIDLEIDTEALRIGNLADYLAGESFCKDEQELWNVLRPILEKNLAAQNADWKADITNRVFDLANDYTLDIPYYVSGDKYKGDIPNFIFGRCPENADICDLKHYYTYNLADDTKRVNALVKLMRVNADATFTASGKSAFLCKLANSIAKCGTMALTNEEGKLTIPGLALLK